MPQANTPAGDAAMQAVLEQIKEQRARYAARPITGERIYLPRAGQDAIEVILYRPAQKTAAPLPVFFNLHGGAWVGGDAVLLDSFCALLADKLPALVVNLNYKKADERPFPYQQQETCDAVLYFARHAGEYGADKAKFALGGHSAGAHISAGAAIRLKELGFGLACQMLVYPFTDFTAESGLVLWGKPLSAFYPVFFSGCGPEHRWLSPLRARDDELRGVAPAIVVTCGPDELKPHGLTYAKRLMDASVPVKYREYPDALHGFLEVNRPEYEGDERCSPEQLAMAKDCERYLIRELRAYLEV